MPKSEKVILLVEDNEAEVKLALRAFQKQSFDKKILVARDGEEALQLLFELASSATTSVPNLPSLILLDLNLPKVDGLEVLQTIRSQSATRYIPVVIFTTSDETRDIQESYRLGANSYLRKPVDFDDFTELVGNLESYWLNQNLTL
jgi:two-component system response regulator